MKEFLVIKQLVKRYEDELILNHINLSIAEGEFLVILGPSGCGKSTLLNCITGLTPIDEGDVFINGVRVNDVHPSKRNLAMVFQSYALYPNMTVQQNIRFGMELRKMHKVDIAAKLKEVTELLKIGEHLTKKPAQLSGGQRQRVAIARALVRKPELFLFDEPLSNLDAKLRVDMRVELKKLHKRLAATILYVTHDQLEAMTLASRIAVMEGGNVVQFDTPENIYHHPATLFVARFIGTPVMNILPVRLQKHAGSWTLSLLPAASSTANATNNAAAKKTAGITFKLPAPKHPDKLEHQLKTEGDKLLMGLRAEFIHEAKQSTTHNTTVTATVEVVEPVGSDTFIICTMEGHELTARLAARALVRSGTQVQLTLDLNQLLLFSPQRGTRIIY